MTLLCLWILMQFGLAYIVGHSAISRPFRELLAPEELKTFGHALRQFTVTLVECPACFGFWAGGISLWVASIYVTMPVPLYVACPAAALVTSGSNYLLARLTGLVPPVIEVETMPEVAQQHLELLLARSDVLEARLKRLDEELRPLAK